MAWKHAKQGESICAGTSLRGPLQSHQVLCAGEAERVHVGCKQPHSSPCNIEVPHQTHQNALRVVLMAA